MQLFTRPRLFSQVSLMANCPNFAHWNNGTRAFKLSHFERRKECHRSPSLLKNTNTQILGILMPRDQHIARSLKNFTWLENVGEGSVIYIIPSYSQETWTFISRSLYPNIGHPHILISLIVYPSKLYPDCVMSMSLLVFVSYFLFLSPFSELWLCLGQSPFVHCKGFKCTQK